ncbi:MAG: hypothetical protein H0W36_10700 [Gemmatimonadetes bacterium]|nr:hypothetical protein [Gemmatimonadota bacterium]
MRRSTRTRWLQAFGARVIEITDLEHAARETGAFAPGSQLSVMEGDDFDDEGVADPATAAAIGGARRPAGG